MGAAGGQLTWQEEVAQRAARSLPIDLGVLARDVRRALRPAAPVPWHSLLQRVRRRQPEPSHVLYDLLQKALTGELEVLQGEPGSIGQFSLRLCEPSRVPAAMEEDGPPRPDP